MKNGKKLKEEGENYLLNYRTIISN